MTTAYIEEQFERHRSVLTPTAEVDRARRAALTQFDKLGLPTRKHEQWRYTDIGAIRNGPFDLVPPEPGADLAARAHELAANARLDQSNIHCVLLDGHLVSALSDADLPAGLEIKQLDSQLADAMDASETPRIDRALTALNAAFSQHGAIIRIAESAELERQIELFFIGSGGRLAPQPRVLIELGDGARAEIVQHFLDLDDEETSWLNPVTEIRQASSSHLKLYRLQDHGASAIHTALIQASLGRDAGFEYGGIDLGSRLTRNDIEVALLEPGSNALIAGITMVANEQHVDNHIQIDHCAAHTTSRQSLRNVAADRAHAVYNGKVIVRPDAQKIDAHQASDNLLLSRRAEIDTKPELEIYADDVKCSHGATLGEIDEDQMFYLRARGIDENAARELLTFAFVNAILEEFRFPALQRRIAARIAGQMLDALDVIETQV